jgi:O-antigen/teichoic acid export membrane protein
MDQRQPKRETIASDASPPGNAMSISRNTGYNVVGALIPIALALFTVPVYLHLVGADRYGVLAIAWLLLGYFGLFDLGLGRATAHRIAALHAAPPEERARTFWTAFAVNLAMGIVGGLVLWQVSAWFFTHHFKVADAIRPEIIAAAPLLGLSVPVATLTGVMIGALQGRQRFRESTLVSTLSTILFQLLPLGVAWLNGPNLVPLLAAALIARVIAILALWCYTHAEVTRGFAFAFDRVQIAALLKYGGWVTATGLIAPLLVTVDRFAIGATIGAVAVAVYTVPFNLAQRMTIFPTALTNALFPRLSAAVGEEEATLGLMASQALAGMMTLPVLGAILIIDPFLRWWVGPAIGEQAGLVGKIILIGFWANAFALVPYTRLQARGRPDLVTKILLIQIPPYLLALYLALKHFGLPGCAVVFSTRCAIDYLLLSLATGKALQIWPLLLFNLALLIAATLATEYLAMPEPLWWPTAVALAAAAVGCAWWTLPASIKGKIIPLFGPLAYRLGKTG